LVKNYGQDRRLYQLLKMNNKHKLIIGAGIGIVILIIMTLTLHKTRNERIEECFDKPTNTGVEMCLRWVAETTNLREAIQK